jgi:hypothetical protein
MNTDPPWKEIALQYKKEIEQLHRDIEHALEELDKKMPRSFEKGIGILDHALDDSQKNIYLISLSEYPIISKAKNPESPERKKSLDCFEGIL